MRKRKPTRRRKANHLKNKLPQSVAIKTRAGYIPQYDAVNILRFYFNCNGTAKKFFIEREGKWYRDIALTELLAHDELQSIIKKLIKGSASEAEFESFVEYLQEHFVGVPWTLLEPFYFQYLSNQTACILAPAFTSQNWIACQPEKIPQTAERINLSERIYPHKAANTLLWHIWAMSRAVHPDSEPVRSAVGGIVAQAKEGAVVVSDGLGKIRNRLEWISVITRWSLVLGFEALTLYSTYIVQTKFVLQQMQFTIDSRNLKYWAQQAVESDVNSEGAVGNAFHYLIVDSQASFDAKFNKAAYALNQQLFLMMITSFISNFVYRPARGFGQNANGNVLTYLLLYAVLYFSPDFIFSDVSEDDVVDFIVSDQVEATMAEYDSSALSGVYEFFTISRPSFPTVVDFLKVISPVPLMFVLDYLSDRFGEMLLAIKASIKAEGKVTTKVVAPVYTQFFSQPKIDDMFLSPEELKQGADQSRVVKRC